MKNNTDGNEGSSPLHHWPLNRIAHYVIATLYFCSKCEHACKDGHFWSHVAKIMQALAVISAVSNKRVAQY